MSDDHATPAASSPPPARGLRLGAVVDRAVRLAVMLVLVAVGLALVQTYRELLHDSPPSGGGRTPPEESFRGANGTPLASPGGTWSLGEGTRTLTPSDLADPSALVRSASPGPREDGTAEGREEHLLPLPLRVATLARRRGPDGRLSAELVRTETGLEDCLRLWASDGWSSRRLTETDAPMELIELSKAGRTVHVGRLAAKDGRPACLLLTVPPSQGNP